MRDEKVTITVFDKEKVFNDEIKGKLDEIVALCNINRIPFFYSACVANNENGAKYKSDAICASEKGIFMEEDKIAKHIAVCAGFDVIPHRSDLDRRVLDFEDDFVLDDRLPDDLEDDFEI